MGGAAIEAATAQVAAAMIDHAKKVEAGVAEDPPVTFTWVGMTVKAWLRDTYNTGMGTKAVGQSLDDALRAIGYQIAPLPED